MNDSTEPVAWKPSSLAEPENEEEEQKYGEHHFPANRNLGTSQEIALQQMLQDDKSHSDSHSLNFDANQLIT
jgi:hypothetical protein